MIVNFFGRRGSGKTTAIQNQIQFLPRPVVILDFLGNFKLDTTRDEFGVEIPFKNQYFFTDAAKVISQLKDKNTEKIIFQPHDINIGMDYICAALWEIGDCTLVLDEIDVIDYAMVPCFDQIVRYGRNRGIFLVTGCRRPAEISRNITAGANKIFCFQTNEPRDIEYFSKGAFGDFAEKLLHLKKYHGIYIDYDEGTKGEFESVEGRIFTLTQEAI